MPNLRATAGGRLEPRTVRTVRPKRRTRVARPKGIEAEAQEKAPDPQAAYDLASGTILAKSDRVVRQAREGQSPTSISGIRIGGVSESIVGLSLPGINHRDSPNLMN